MRSWKKSYVTFFILFLLFHYIPTYCISQNKDEKEKFLDSVNHVISNAKHDTTIVGSYLILAGVLYTINIDTLRWFCNEGKIIAERNLREKSLDSIEEKTFNSYLATSFNNLGFYYNFIGDKEMAINCMESSLVIKKRLNDYQALATTLNNIGFITHSLGNSSKALKCYTECIEIQRKLGDLKGIATTLNNIASILENLGNIPKALDFYHFSLKIREQINDSSGQADCFNNIGLVFQNQEEYDKSIEYFEKSKELRIQIDDKIGLAISLNNLGLINSKLKNPKIAENYFRKSLELKKEMGDKAGIAYSLNSLGTLFFEMNQLDSSRVYFNKSLILCLEIRDKHWEASNLNGLGQIEFKEGDLVKAQKYLEESMAIAHSLGYPENILSAANLLKEIFRIVGDYEKSLNFYETYVLMKDSIKNSKTEKAAIKQGMKYEYDKVMLERQKEQEIKDAVNQKEKEQQRAIIFASIFGLLIVLVFAIIINNRLKLTRRQKKIIEVREHELEEMNEELNQQNEEILTQRDKIEQQKEFVEEKNREILDSISYAKRIQNALLVSERQQNVLPEHFILFMPKDIVSGDFYWTAHKDNFDYVTVADCTGHGVPGAFMSMLGIAFLNEILTVQECITPAIILDKLRNRIIQELNQGQEKGESKDGMDMSMIAIHKDRKRALWAGANNPLYVIPNVIAREEQPVPKSREPKQSGNQETDCFAIARNDGFEGIPTNNPDSPQEITEIRPDKMPVAIHLVMTPFINHEIQLSEGDLIYLFSDGYVDQFGGQKSKKFKAKYFKELLLGISNKTMKEQHEILEKKINDWMNWEDDTNIVSHEQTDDITVIGLKI